MVESDALLGHARCKSLSGFIERCGSFGLYIEMKDHKIDYDVIFRNCERFGVKVEKGEGLHGVTMNGEEFDIVKVMENYGKSRIDS